VSSLPSNEENAARIAHLLTTRVRPGGAVVLNADEPESAELMSRLRHGTTVVLFSESSMSSVVARHVAAGGTACVLHGDWLELHRPEGRRRIVRAGSIAGPLSPTGTAPVTEALIAIGACAALSLAPEIIGAALMSFGVDAEGVTVMSPAPSRNTVQDPLPVGDSLGEVVRIPA
jgi:cyanophycin synthetase